MESRSFLFLFVAHLRFDTFSSQSSSQANGNQLNICHLEPNSLPFYGTNLSKYSLNVGSRYNYIYIYIIYIYIYPGSPGRPNGLPRTVGSGILNPRIIPPRPATLFG